jgi:hypothetical protein
MIGSLLDQLDGPAVAWPDPPEPDRDERRIRAMTQFLSQAVTCVAHDEPVPTGVARALLGRSPDSPASARRDVR